MWRRLLWSIISAVVVTVQPGAAQSQSPADAPGWDAIQPEVIATRLGDRYVALARAFPAELYGWRPMDGVRSVAEVFAHVTAVAYVRPAAFGVEPPSGVARDFTAEYARLSALPKERLVTELERALIHYADLVRGLEEEARRSRTVLFGREVQVGAAVTILQVDMHEHLGQAIAYARINGIVPPWSM